MSEIISACGDVCSICPRFLPKEDKELKRAAELWYKIGYRENIVSNSEIGCTGCTVDNQCRYQIIQCTTERGINNCGHCDEYPCEKINEAIIKTMIYEPKCKKYCTAEEYEIMRRAFFEKKMILDKENKSKA